MSLLNSVLELSGVSFSIKELSCEDAAKLVEKELLKMKTDLYSINAEGLSVPEAMNQVYRLTKLLHNSLKNREKRQLNVSVSIDAGKVDRQTADVIITRVKEIEQS